MGKDHLALKCSKFHKVRGNLLKMHNPVKPKKAASFFKKDFEEHISEPEELNACFVYQDENF